MDYPKISIVTPNFNKGAYIEESIKSVLDQNYPNLEYIVIDGASTDDSTDIIRKYESDLKYWVSEKDEGMYHALQKGFSRSTGEIMGWLNSDDILHHKSLFTIAEIFSRFNNVNWIQGHPTVIDRTGRIVYNRNARNNKIDFYKKKYKDGIFIQQESTYWRRSLWEKAGGGVSTEFKYAGDFELWMRFFEHAKLFNIPAMIGAFRICGDGQLSTNNYAAYLKECDHIIDNMVLKLDKSVLKSLEKKKRWNLFDNYQDQEVPSARIEYDFSKQEFYLASQ